MDDLDDERTYHFGKRPDRTYVSKSFGNAFAGKKMRIVSKVIDHEEGLAFAEVKDEVLLRRTAKGRLEIKATVLEDDRSIKTLTIQKYTPSSGPSEHIYFSLVGKEIEAFLTFVLGIKTMPLGDDAKIRLSDDQLRDIILNDSQARQIFTKNEELFTKIAQSEGLKCDLVAIGYRRAQLARFDDY